MEQLLHTPEGVRDIYNQECKKKICLENKLHNVLSLYGYRDIQTPTFEYFDVFGKEMGTISSRELYKFFDKEGNTLVLRPDFTPSIVRAAATLFPDDDMPVRLCYTGNTFINHTESYQGRLRENTQMGAELLGVDSAAADAEMLAMAIHCLQAIGLADFQVSISNVSYFRHLLQAADLTPDEELRVRELIGNRNYLGLEEYLSSIKVPEAARKALTALEDLYGMEEVLDKAYETSPCKEATEALDRLREVHEILKMYDADCYINYDLSMSGLYGYYTGLIFRGYTYGTGDAIVKGGRYDHLMEKFGKKSPSIGFAFVIDQLMAALSRQHIAIEYDKVNVLLLYDRTMLPDAVSRAKEYRDAGMNVELMEKKDNKDLTYYLKYQKEGAAEKLIYMPASGEYHEISDICPWEGTSCKTDIGTV